MVLAEEPFIGMLSPFSENVVCDPDIWSHDHENVSLACT